MLTEKEAIKEARRATRRYGEYFYVYQSPDGTYGIVGQRLLNNLPIGAWDSVIMRIVSRKG